MIYFDNASTTYPKPEAVYQRMDRWLRGANVNPSRGAYQLAIKAADKVFETRALLARLFNIENPMQIIFTANGTEALNLALKGVLNKGDHVVTTSMEHNSMIRPIMALGEQGVTYTIVQADAAGLVDAKKIAAAICPKTKLVAMTHVSNVTGTLQPITEVGRLTSEKNILFLVDAAQSAGTYEVDVNKMNIDLLAAPGHKGLMGPQGTGFLYIKEGLRLETLKEGGTGNKSEILKQPETTPERYESGSLNAPGIVGLGAGVQFILETGVEQILNHKQQLTTRFLRGLGGLAVNVYGKPEAGVVALNLKKFEPSEVSYLLDEAFEIATRSGLHCAPLAHESIGTGQTGALRFSFSYFNTTGEIDTALEALGKISELA